MKHKSVGHVNWMRWRERIYGLLERYGPLPEKEIVEALGLTKAHIYIILVMYGGEFQMLDFVQSGRTRSTMFVDLVKASPILTLKGDHRIVDFAASHISLKVRTGYDAKAVVDFLKWQMGYSLAREVVERLGYDYKTAPRGHRN